MKENVHIYHAEQGFVPADASDDPTVMHHHSSRVDRMLRNFGLGGAAIAVTPPLLYQMGVGKDQYDILKSRCCPILSDDWNKWGDQNTTAWNKNAESAEKAISHNQSVFGIAGKLTHMFQQIPGFNKENPTHVKLTTSSIHNAMLAGGIIVAGHAAGWGVEKLQEKNRDDGSHNAVGRIIKDSTHLLGIFTALPTILPGIGHGLLYLSSTVGIDKLVMPQDDPHYKTVAEPVDSEKIKSNKLYHKMYSRGPAGGIAMLLGKNPGQCLQDGKMLHTGYGIAAVLGAQLCCALPALIPLVTGQTTRYLDNHAEKRADQRVQNRIDAQSSSLESERVAQQDVTSLSA